MRQRLSREEFRRWAAGQKRRYERLAGEPIAMSPERIGHARIKNRIWAALDSAIQIANVPCEALGDGVTVEIDEDTDYEPDAVVNCGPPLSDDAIAASNPVIVVEVTIPINRAHRPGRQTCRLLPACERSALPHRASSATRGDPSSPLRRRDHQPRHQHWRYRARPSRHHHRPRRHLPKPSLTPRPASGGILVSR